MNKAEEKLTNEINKYMAVCDKLMSQRYTTQKYDDKWSDALFKEYQIAKTRIQLLIEMIFNQQGE